jgi:DNA-binding transcriptional LysR family regulator
VDRLECMRVFVAVAESGGFAAGARRLGVSPPVVTRAVASLEEHLGAQILTRTTRKVRLTEPGARYLEDCRRLLSELDDVESAVSGSYSEPRGSLAITASVMFGRLYVAPLLLDFLARHLKLDARLLLNDHVVDLIDEGLDLAVRIAKLSDSSLTALRVGEVRRVVCAYMIAPELRAGRLRLVLEDHEPEPLPIHLLYREGRRAPARVRAFVDFASHRLRADLALNPRSQRQSRSMKVGALPG